MNFAVNTGLANAAGDQLGDLRAEVDDQDGVVAGGGVWVLHGEALASPHGFRKLMSHAKTQGSR
jgi:hypothetical protein